MTRTPASHQTDYLLYAMTHVVRSGTIEADCKFASNITNAAKDRWFRPSAQQIRQMVEVEARFYSEGDAA